MKAFVLTLFLPALMLIGCGQLETNETTAGNALQNAVNNGAISEQDAMSVNEDLLEENLQMTEMSSNSIMMKLGGAELLIDFIENLSGDPAETAMIINGVEVTTQVAADPQSLQGLIASLVSNQLEGKEVLGIPLMDLVNMGLGLVTGDSSKADFSNLFGTLVRGALNMFVGSSPIGAIIGTLAGPLLDGIFGGGDPNQTSNNNNNNSSDPLGGALNNLLGGFLGGGGGGSSSNPLGGIFSLITNLFKPVYYCIYFPIMFAGYFWIIANNFQ